MSLVGFCHGPFVSSINAIVRSWEAQFQKHPKGQKPTVKMWFVETIQDSSHTKKRVPFAFGGQYNDIGSWRKGAR